MSSRASFPWVDRQIWTFRIVKKETEKDLVVQDCLVTFWCKLSLCLTDFKTTSCTTIESMYEDKLIYTVIRFPGHYLHSLTTLEGQTG